MKNSSLWVRTGIIIVITLVGVFMVFGPSYKIFQQSANKQSESITSDDFTWTGIQQNLKKNIKRGLDLQGGVHLVMQVKVEEYLKTLTSNAHDGAVNAAKEAKLEVGEGSIIAEKNNYQVSVDVKDETKTGEVLEAINKKGIFDASWVQSTNGSTLNWSLPIPAQKQKGQDAVEQAYKVIETRINQFGVKEPVLQKIGGEDSGQILLQMPGEDDAERVKKLIGDPAKLELMKVVGATSPNPITTYPSEAEALASIGGKNTSTRKVLPYLERDDNSTDQPNQPNTPPKAWVVVESPAVIDGGEIRQADPVPLTGTDKYYVSFALKPAGAAKFGKWTSDNIGAYMAVVLNNQVKSAPFIKERISDQGQIDGRFTRESAADLVLTLKSGALPADIRYEEERTVGPSLGADSIRAGVAASLGGLAFVIIFMLFYYRGSGINAVIALLLNMLLTMAGLIWFESTLTLPGIAGLILGIGMAVDSNVLIFERIREELRTGKTVVNAVDLGFDRAFITIIDTHITTILSSLILYMYGSGPIRGFAVTLILGLLINLFSAVFVSRTIFMWLLNKKPKMEKLSI
jgi:preprotein translocase subunit SecD